MVTISCPACNKASPLDGAEECQRCRCDLTPLRTLTRQSLGYLARSASALKRGNGADALTLAERSWALRHSLASAGLAFLGAAASNDLSAALRWRKRAGE